MDNFERGYEFIALEALGTIWGMDSAKWINDVEAAIEELYSAMNSYDHYKATAAAQESLKGFLAEEWTVGTANVDAAVKRLPLEGARLNSHDLGSADIKVGEDLYQLKYIADPKNAARKLATTLNDAYKSRAKSYRDLTFEEWTKLEGFEGRGPSELLYSNMKALVPPEVLEGAKLYALKRIERARQRGLSGEVERWTKVHDELTDRIRTIDGVESRPATNAKIRDKAVRVSNNERLKPTDDGLTTDKLIENRAILQYALKAGASSAAIGAALKIAPEIYRAIDYLIQEGELDDDHLRSIGVAAYDGAATGFITGSAASAITAGAGKGMFGQSVKSAVANANGANVIAALVVLTVETCRDSYMVASGRKEPAEMASGLSQSLFKTVCGLAGTSVAAAVAPEAAIPALIGSFVGAAAGGLAFKSGASCVMRICSTSGFTFFGLVEQDYELPPELLRKLGVRGASVKTARVSRPNLSKPRFATGSVRNAGLHSLGIAFVERNIVGVNKIGYSLT